MSIFGNKLREWRKSKGMTQGELGKELGINRENVSRWETGQHVPETESLELLYRICPEAKFWDSASDYIQEYREAILSEGKEEYQAKLPVLKKLFEQHITYLDTQLNTIIQRQHEIKTILSELIYLPNNPTKFY